MKSTGIVRKLDNLGRLVLPSELRRKLNLNEGDSIDFFVDEDKIILKRYEVNNQCVITGEVTDLNKEVYGINLSPDGAKKLLNALMVKIGSEK